MISQEKVIPNSQVFLTRFLEERGVQSYGLSGG